VGAPPRCRAATSRRPSGREAGTAPWRRAEGYYCRPPRNESRLGLDDNHHCYVNEEGLLDDPQYFFMFSDGHQPIAGRGVILSTTEDGGEAPAGQGREASPRGAG